MKIDDISRVVLYRDQGREGRTRRGRRQFAVRPRRVASSGGSGEWAELRALRRCSLFRRIRCKRHHTQC